MTEQWMKVPSFGGYIVSSLGRVRQSRVNAPILKGSYDSDGYHRVKLAGCTLRTHVIVAEAFHGPRPEGMQCAHLDGNPRNNRAANLAWVTPKENASHKELHGTNYGNGGMPGERHPLAKLTAEQVSEIRASTGTSQAVAKQYGISQPHVVRIRNGDRWSRNGIAQTQSSTPDNKDKPNA